MKSSMLYKRAGLRFSIYECYLFEVALFVGHDVESDK
jgi:hypothetical protein